MASTNKQQNTVKKSSKKTKRELSHCVVHVLAVYNNTHITVTDSSGRDTVAWASAGQYFKGSRKRTPHAAETASQSLIEKIKGFGVKTCEVVIKGAGPGRDAAVKPFAAAGIQVLTLKDRTAVPHNGCRPPKERRA